MSDAPTTTATTDPTSSTSTSYPCPHPTEPFCGLPCEQINNCAPSTIAGDELVEVTPATAPGAEPVPVSELAYTGPALESVLLVIAALLIAAGAALVKVADR